MTLIALAGVALVVWHDRHGRDLRGSPTVEFVPPRTVVTPARPPRRLPSLAWPTYGFDAARTRSVVTNPLAPPFRRLWVFHGRALLEFPPALGTGRVFLPTFDGRLYALDARTGHVLWRYRSRRCSWASPALAGGLVVETFLNRRSACDRGVDGELVAFVAQTGRIRWRVALPPTESSPLVLGGSVYVGAWDGTVRAYALASGRLQWTARLGGAVKGSLAAANGRLYVGAYDGELYCFARSGRILWHSGSPARLLRGRGRFYSTPAIAYGRVYLGSTDGSVYSFGATSGRLRWASATGGYVYASPAVFAGLVLAGSYDGWFSAYDAATGARRWRFKTNGPISGSASVIDGIAYVSTLHERTYALNARTGRLLWTFPDGKYSPAVTDGRRLYLVGLGRLYALAPISLR